MIFAQMKNSRTLRNGGSGRGDSESKSHQELLRQSKDIKYWDMLDKSKHIFIHHPFENWSTCKQEDELILLEANFPISLLYSSQILFVCLSISMLLVPKTLNGKHLQGQQKDKCTLLKKLKGRILIYKLP